MCFNICVFVLKIEIYIIPNKLCNLGDNWTEQFRTEVFGENTGKCQIQFFPCSLDIDILICNIFRTFAQSSQLFSKPNKITNFRI